MKCKYSLNVDLNKSMKIDFYVVVNECLHRLAGTIYYSLILEENKEYEISSLNYQERNIR